MTILQIGPHRVKHGSITDGIADLMQGEKVDLVYSDPPWGQGNISFWQTYNNKTTGAAKQHIDYDAFMRAVFTAIVENVKPNAPVLIEYGQKWRDDVIARAASYGLKHQTTVEVLYRAGKPGLLPLDLHVFGYQSDVAIPAGWVEGVYHTYGYDCISKAIKPFTKPGGLVLDPCCGMGYTAQTALDNGMAFRGNELNRMRLQKTIDRLEKAAR